MNIRSALKIIHKKQSHELKVMEYDNTEENLTIAILEIAIHYYKITKNGEAIKGVVTVPI